MMANEIKRPWFIILFCTFLVLNGLLSLFSDERWEWKAVKIVGGLLVLLPLIRSLIYRHYLILKDGVVTWHRIYAATLHLRPEEIREVKLDQRPFRSSRIFLQNGRQYKLEDNLIPFERLRAFFHQAGVPVNG